MDSLRISTPQIEGVLQVAKQLKFQVLLDPLEMEDLLNALDPLYIYVAGQKVELDAACILKGDFLSAYNRYAQELKEGKVPEVKILQKFFSSIWSADPHAVYAMPVPGSQYLIKQVSPVIQLQAHSVFYSDLDGEFHPMVLSQESITWGIQFSYPQIFQDPKTQSIEKVSSTSLNSHLFTKLKRWLREFTCAMPFCVENKRVNAPIRIGKKALEWIDFHPQLVQKGIRAWNLIG
ncbi:MAG: hypothetical protein HYZ48_02595 [Chlamydiales bacterium]|nr:hypothetical protein [Chlamydiales bacterium]